MYRKQAGMRIGTETKKSLTKPLKFPGAPSIVAQAVIPALGAAGQDSGQPGLCENLTK